MSSSSKPIKQFPLYSGTGVTASFQTNATEITFQSNVAYEIIWANATNTPSGTFTVQAAIGKAGQSQSSLIWSTLPMSPTNPQVDSASGTHLLSLNQVPFNFIRLAYTANASTSADITINLQAKEL